MKEDSCLKRAQNATSALPAVKPTKSNQAASHVILELTFSLTATRLHIALVVQKGRCARMARLKTAPSAHKVSDSATQNVSNASQVLTILEKPALAKRAHLESTKICEDIPAARSAQSQAQPLLGAQTSALTAYPTTSAPILPR